MAKSTIFSLILALLAFSGCGKNFHATAPQTYPFQDRVQEDCEGKVCVTVAVPSPQETRQIFQVPMEKKGIQPVWIQVTNKEKIPFLLLLTSVDPEYYAPNEVAYKFRHTYKKPARQAMGRFYSAMAVDPYVLPGQSNSGFLFTHLDRDRKEFSVEVISENSHRRLAFIVPVPGFRADYHEVDFDTLYEGQDLPDYDLKGLRKAIDELPCCTTVKGETRGDAINLVVIGEDEEVFPAFVRSGWNETEAKYKGSFKRTFASYMSRREYKYAPMSDLYIFDRRQDMGLQKARETPHERNHLRLWLAPFTFQGKPVWVGAISRDIGIMYTVKSPYLFLTHKIDPDIDKTRGYLAEDFFQVRAVEKVAWAKGVGVVSQDQPRKDPMGNPYFTDGLRIVLFLSDQPREIEEVDFLEWENPR